MFDMSRAKIKGKAGVQCSGERTQNLPPFIRSGYPKIASAVHLTTVLCGIAPVSSEQACFIIIHSHPSCP